MESDPHSRQLEIPGSQQAPAGEAACCNQKRRHDPGQSSSAARRRRSRQDSVICGIPRLRLR